MFKVIVAGSRSFNDFSFLVYKLDHVLQNYEQIEIVSGTARGADQEGEKYAFLRNYPIKQFPANWDAHGNSAGYIRNEEMAKYADACVVFWDGKSRGTKHMINLAKKHNLKLKIYRFTPED